MPTTRTYSVPDIHCGHCRSAIEGEVGQVDGVVDVTVDIEARSVSVEGDAPEDAILGAIQEAGYVVSGEA